MPDVPAEGLHERRRARHGALVHLAPVLPHVGYAGKGLEVQLRETHFGRPEVDSPLGPTEPRAVVVEEGSFLVGVTGVHDPVEAPCWTRATNAIDVDELAAECSCTCLGPSSGARERDHGPHDQDVIHVVTKIVDLHHVNAYIGYKSATKKDRYIQ